MKKSPSKQARPDFLDRDDLYRALVEQLPTVSYVVRVNDDFGAEGPSPTIYISPQVQEVFGFTREEWQSDPALWIKQLHPKDRDRTLATVEGANRSKTGFELDYRALRKDGRAINIYNTARYLRGTDGAYYTQGVMFDVSARKRRLLREAVLAHCAEALREESDISGIGLWLRAKLDEVLPVTNLMLALKDRHTGWLSFPVYFDEVDPPAQPRPHARSLIDYVLDTNQAMHWKRPGDREAFEQAGYRVLGTPSSDWIGVPISAGDQALGVIAVQTYQDGEFYAAEDVALLESIATALGNELHKFQLSQDIRQRLIQEELLAFVSTEAVETDNVDAFLRTVIEEMGRRLNVSRSYLFEHREHAGEMSNTIEWCAPGITPQKEHLQNLSVEEFGWHVAQLKRGSPVAFRDVREIPDKTIREEMLREDIISQIAVPLFVDGVYFGFVGFDECRTVRMWPESDLPILQAIARIITHVIEREGLKAKRAEQLKELQSWHDITLGREKRVLELKQEVNDLLVRLNESPRYNDT